MFIGPREPMPSLSRDWSSSSSQVTVACIYTYIADRLRRSLELAATPVPVAQQLPILEAPTTNAFSISRVTALSNISDRKPNFRPIVGCAPVAHPRRNTQSLLSSGSSPP